MTIGRYLTAREPQYSVACSYLHIRSNDNGGFREKMFGWIRKVVRKILSYSLAPILEYSANQIQEQNINTALYELSCRRAIQSSVDYAEQKMPSALMFKMTASLWDYALSKISVEGLCVEFGVWRGRSINYFAKRMEIVYGFDSFEGLREDWAGWGFAKGAFSLQGKMPKVATNVRLIKGWFNETIPAFLDAHSGPLSFVHIDCDTYESAALTLNLIKPRILPGTVIVFDEYFGYRGWQSGGEFRAWAEFVLDTGTKYEYLAFSSQQVAIRLISV